MKNLKDKLETREPDAVKNKSMLYLNFRLFLDPLLFTFIETIDQNVLKPMIKDKFNKYLKIGLFKVYSNLLNSYNLEDINENKIIEFVDLLQSKIINNCETIDESHKILYDNNIVKLSNENDLTLEQ